MRTRNAETTPKSLPPKKTLTKKTPIKTPPKPPEASTDSTTPKSAPSTGATKQKTGVAAKQVTPPKTATPKLEPKVEEASTSVDAAGVTPEVKPAPVVKTAVKKTPGKTTKAASAVKTVVSKTPAEPVEAVKTEVEPIVETIKSPTAVKTASTKTTKLVKTVKRKVVVPRKSDEPVVVKTTKSPSVDKAASSKTLKSPKKEEPVVTTVNSEELSVSKVVDSPKENEPSVSKVVESPKKYEPNVVNVKESHRKELVVSKVVEAPKKEAAGKEVVETPMEGEAETGVTIEEEEVNEQAEEDPEGVYDTNEPEGNLVNMEEHSKEVEAGKELIPEEESHSADEGMVDYGEQEGFEEPGDEEFADDEAVETDERAGGEEVEQLEISAIAKERKIKKELEVFVGGLDRDAVEDDVKKAFDCIGEIVEVRLHKNPQTNKNKGFAFVKFANKEQASKALAEMKNPVIRGKRCGVAPSEDNDTLFVGNICNTWTKEAIKQKMKEYGIEGVENVTLVPDAQHEGLSRGFAFVEFSCHADAMLAYKRLQKPDVVFGHTERTAKVAFAEPLREPDPEIMAQVKSVFVDGLPPHWDEEHVREHFKVYGDIERIVLARNMPTAKRKDFGFVDFTTHGAAVACIDGVNNTELGDGKSKTKVKVRLASPLPKTQAVKGGLCGGFRIGHANSGISSRFGRGFGRGGHSFNRGNFQHNKEFHTRGRGQRGRFSYAGHDDFETPYYEFPERRSFGGRGGRRDYGPYGEEFSSQAATSSRPDLGWHRRGAVERGRGRSVQSRRQPFSPEGHYSRPFGGRHFVDDPYTYNDSGHGIKRPYSMMDHEPGYLEPSRLRPRFDYSDPVVSTSGNRYQGSYGASSGLYSHDYYGSDYGGSSYSSMYGGGDRSYGGGYYY